MGYTKQSKQPKRRYGGKKRYQRKKLMSSVLINKGPIFMPDTYLTTMTYNKEFSSLNGNQVNPSTGYHRFRLNDITDPDKTGFGTYPLGYSEMRAIYRKFYVSSCRYKITAIVTSVAGAENAARITTLPFANGNAKLEATFANILANPRSSKPRYVGPNFGNNIVTIHGRATTQGVSGFKNPSTEQDFTSDTDQDVANPPKQNHDLYIYWQNATNATQPAIVFTVELIYNVKFYDRRIQYHDTALTLSKLDSEYSLFEQTRSAHEGILPADEDIPDWQPGQGGPP